MTVYWPVERCGFLKKTRRSHLRSSAGKSYVWEKLDSKNISLEVYIEQVTLGGNGLSLKFGRQVQSRPASAAQESTCREPVS